VLPKVLLENKLPNQEVSKIVIGMVQETELRRVNVEIITKMAVIATRAVTRKLTKVNVPVETIW